MNAEKRIVKKLSDTYKELEIDFAFPIEINDVNGNRTYCEERNGYWNKSEYDANGNVTYYEDSEGYWSKSEYDANGNRTYFEDSDDYWYKRECDDNGKETYFEDNEDYWCRYEYDDNGKETYFEDSKGTKCGTPRSQPSETPVTNYDETVKPPVDIESEWIWKQKRCFELVRAIARYDAAGRCMDEAWFLELGKLIPETFPERDCKHSPANRPID